MTGTISVPHELLERILRKFTYEEIDEVRRLLTQLNTCTKDGDQLARVETAAAGIWREGSPVHPWDSEWFLAEMRQGHLVVLKPLPKEWSYDFTTADGTYVLRDSIIRWAQLSSSEYVKPAQAPVVLPERVDPNYFDSIRATGIGWNACLDEFKRLNNLE